MAMMLIDPRFPERFWKDGVAVRLVGTALSVPRYEGNSIAVRFQIKNTGEAVLAQSSYPEVVVRLASVQVGCEYEILGSLTCRLRDASDVLAEDMGWSVNVMKRGVRPLFAQVAGSPEEACFGGRGVILGVHPLNRRPAPESFVVLSVKRDGKSFQHFRLMLPDVPGLCERAQRLVGQSSWVKGVLRVTRPQGCGRAFFDPVVGDLDAFLASPVAMQEST